MAEGWVVVVVEDIDRLQRWGEGETIVIMGLALALMSVLVLVLVLLCMVVMAGRWWLGRLGQAEGECYLSTANVIHSFQRLRADRDSSCFLLLPLAPLVAVKVTVMAVAAAVAAGRRARWSSLSSLSDARDCLGCEVVVEVVGPARVAALRVP